MTSCPSGTTANSATGKCDTTVTATAEDTCTNKKGNLCVERMYKSWMIYVVGGLNLALLAAFGVHILTSIFGVTFMGTAQQSASQGFGGRSENYIDETASQSNIDINKDENKKNNKSTE